jgi:hypothetical protein
MYYHPGAKLYHAWAALQEAEDLVGQIDVGGQQSEEVGSGGGNARGAIAHSALW